MVQIPEDKEVVVKKEIQPTAIINQIIDNKKLKGTINDLTGQFYCERRIEYTIDYYDYLVDYDKWADWFRAQEAKNLKENKINKNPKEEVK